MFLYQIRRYTTKFMSESTDFFMFYFCYSYEIRRIGLYIRTLIYLKKEREEDCNEKN